MMGQPCGKRRPIIENKFFASLPQFKRGQKGLTFLPEREDTLFYFREMGLMSYGRKHRTPAVDGSGFVKLQQDITSINTCFVRFNSTNTFTHVRFVNIHHRKLLPHDPALILFSYMKTLHIIALIAVLAFTISSVHARDRQTFAVGARLHTDHSDFLELPFDEGDISYAAAYEYHEDNAYWQIAVTFTPDPSGTPATENVITPA